MAMIEPGRRIGRSPAGRACLRLWALSLCPGEDSIVSVEDICV
jgi:hypothetical protein